MTPPSTGFSVMVATTYPELAEQVLEGIARHETHTVACILTLTSRLDEIGLIADRSGVPVLELPIPTSNFRIDRTCEQNETYSQQIEAAVGRIRQEFSPDILLTFGFPMLPKAILDTPSRDAINVHPADLPAYRGMSPLEAMILDGEKSMRMTAHHLSVKIDGGDMIAKSEVIPIAAGATSGQLWQHVLDGIAVRLILAALDALWNGERADPEELAYKAPEGGRIPDAIGLKRVEVLDPGDGTMKHTNVGVLGKVRIEWVVDTAEELERAARAFDGGVHVGLKLFTDYQRRAFVIDRLVPVDAPPLQESIVPGTILEVIDQSTVVCATTDRRRVQLTGSFRKGIANIEPPVLEPGEAFESTTPIALMTGLPMQGLERTVLSP